MRLITVTNRAGGSGKTSLAVNLAAIWTQEYKTLLIDLDEQADASTWLGSDDTGERLVDSLTGRASLEGAIVKTEFGLDLVPSGEALGFVAEMVHRDAVYRALNTVSHLRYEVVVIDCAPSLTRLVHAAWLAAPLVRALVPVSSAKALRGVARLKNAWEDAGLDPRGLRIALVRHDRRRLLDQEIDRQACNLYGSAVLKTRVRESVVMDESGVWHRPLFHHVPRHPLTNDLRRLASEVMDG